MEILGQKCGMSRRFIEDGSSIPVTIIECMPNVITQIKTVENDGYCAIQIGYGNKKNVPKALQGHFKSSEQKTFSFCKEFKKESINEYSLGSLIKIDIFNKLDFVDVSGVSKGKGFAGAVKRHNFRTQDMTHGNSLSHRAPGSIGQNQSPGKVFKGKKMASQMGNKNVTIQSLRIFDIDIVRNIMFIQGAVPGAIGSLLIIKKAIKK